MKRVFKKSELFNECQLKQIAKISRAVNNDIRALYGQERSHQLAPIEAIKRTLDEPLDPEKSHMAWRESREKDGWTGGEYSQEAKTHPNLLYDSWEALPFEEKLKDFAFYVGVHAAAASMCEAGVDQLADE